MTKKSILIGEKHSKISDSLSTFEEMDGNVWTSVKANSRIPDGFLFLAGIAKYPRRCSTQLRYGKDHIFVQNFLPHAEAQLYKTRGYGALYSFYEPEKLEPDDVVLESSGIYMSCADNRIQLILGNGEHRIASKVAEMFAQICNQRGLLDFSKHPEKPCLFEVTFNKKSCGYFLKGRTYHVWATPIGIPDQQSGELNKGWLLCDVNCGVPAVMKAEREEFKLLSDDEGTRVGLFTVNKDGNLLY